MEVQDIDLIEDADGVPAWIKVEQQLAGIVIVPRLLGGGPPADNGPGCVDVSRTPTEEGHA